MNAIIDRLYDVFRSYRLSTVVDGCEHCVCEEMSEELLKTPLRELTAEQLSSYSLKAMTTWGTLNDFKHFLPRLLELTASDPRQMNWLETLFGKLPLANFSEWSLAERQVVDEYLRELWAMTLARPRLGDRDDIAARVLCALSRSGVDIEPFLATWLHDDSLAATEHLGEFVLANSKYLQKSPPRLGGGFWDVGSQSEAAVIAWLKSPALKERIRRDEPRFADDLIEVLWVIDLF